MIILPHRQNIPYYLKHYVVLLLIFFPFISFSQKVDQPLIDSLLTELPKAKEDTNKVRLLDKLSFTYSNINPSEGLRYAAKTKELAQQLKWDNGIALANTDFGMNYYAQSNQAKALEYEELALKQFEALKNKSGTSALLADIGLVHMAAGNYAKALEVDFQALKIKEEFGDHKNIPVILENIGTIYFEQKNYAKTKEYYNNSLKEYQASNNKRGVARCLGNLGMLEDTKGNYTQALEYLIRGLNTNTEIGNKMGMQVNMQNIGNTYSHMHDFENALKYQLMALKINEELGARNSIAVTLGNIGEIYFAIAKDTTGKIQTNALVPKDKVANVQLAIQYLEKSVRLCKEINYRAPLIEFNQFLSEAYAFSGQYEKAYQSLHEYITAKDSLFSIQNSQIIAELETKRQVELKNKDLLIKDKQIQISSLKEKQKHEESLIYIISIGLLLLIIGIILRSLRMHTKRNLLLTKEKRQQQQILREQVEHIKKQSQLLREISHMQAHHVRGPVASILGLVELFNYNDLTDPTNKVVIEGVANITKELDIAVREVIKKENSLDN